MYSIKKKKNPLATEMAPLEFLMYFRLYYTQSNNTQKKH